MVPVTHSSMHWGFEMKKWIARKLFDLAVKLDWAEVVAGSAAVLLVDGLMKKSLEVVTTPEEEA
jgi:hypothetical protein